MKQILILALATFTINVCSAQKFITSGTIQYEVRTNVRKSIPADDDNSFLKELGEKLPQFTTNFYKYQFNDNKGIYKFENNADKLKVPEWLWFLPREEDDVWYNDYTTKQFIDKKTIDDNILMSGNLDKIAWTMVPHETMLIAGFNCRKATAILYDSVYAFAFYTDEILVSGGPMNMSGLPGMILGLTIPRLYTSWVATGVILDNPPASAITPPTKGKKKNEAEIKQSLLDLSKSWGKDGGKYLNPRIWRTFL